MIFPSFSTGTFEATRSWYAWHSGSLDDGQQKMARSNLLVLKLRRQRSMPCRARYQILALFHLIFVFASH